MFEKANRVAQLVSSLENTSMRSSWCDTCIVDDNKLELCNRSTPKAAKSKYWIQDFLVCLPTPRNIFHRNQNPKHSVQKEKVMPVV